ncbi:hypothetical protein ACOTJR_27935 [Achromobacter xylosoxidans]
MIVLSTEQPKQLWERIQRTVATGKPESWETTEEGQLVLMDWPSRHPRAIFSAKARAGGTFLLLVPDRLDSCVRLFQDQMRFASFLVARFGSEIAGVNVLAGFSINDKEGVGK